MKRTAGTLSLMLLAMTLYFTANCNVVHAQTPDTIQILERLPDGSMLLTIDGSKYRAITADQMRQLQAVKIDGEECTKTSATLNDKILKFQFQVTQLTASVADGEKIAALERKRGDEFKQVYENEVNLRLSVTVPPKRKGVIERVLDNPLTKVVITTATIWAAAKK